MVSFCSKRIIIERVHSNVQNVPYKKSRKSNAVLICNLIKHSPESSAFKTIDFVLLMILLVQTINSWSILSTRWLKIAGALFVSIVNSCISQHLKVLMYIWVLLKLDTNKKTHFVSQNLFKVDPQLLLGEILKQS